MILSQENDKVLQAFMKCRSMINTAVKKDRRNDHLKSSYATLNSVMDSINPALRDAGIVIIQNATYNGSGVLVSTILMHEESFQTITFETLVPIAKVDGQGFGSGMTYGRRYACLGLFGLVPSDDDGAATRRTASDVKKAMNNAADSEALNEIMQAAKAYFSGDATSLNVISAHYEKLKADKLVSESVGFNPLKPAKKAQQQPEKKEVSGNDINPDIDF